MRTQVKRAFTLIEILIVVVILGILAAIVIPQFTDAAQDAALSSTQSQLQTVRSQIELYRIQHQGVLPDVVTDWTDLTDIDAVTGSRYLQQAPRNALRLNAVDTVAGTAATTGTAANVGWVWDAAEEQIYAVDMNGDVLTDPGTGAPF
jgi:general secretion pathway protein G